MLKPIELTIQYEGSFPGQVEKGLSISTFSETLKNLLAAVRYVANANDSSTTKMGTQRSHSGSPGNLLDLQLKEIGTGSLRLTLAIMPADSSFELTPLFIESTRLTAENWLREIKKGWESPDSAAEPIRKYIRSVPHNVNRQHYSAEHDGEILSEITLQSIKKESSEVSRLPYLKSISGVIDSVRWVPRSEHIRIKDESGEQYQCKATAFQIEQAIAMRNSPIVAKVMIGKKGNRVISLHDAGIQSPLPNREERTQYLFSKWNDTLKRLAE